MGIEHIKFLTCDSCGNRFQAAEVRLSGTRVLCPTCQKEDDERTAAGNLGDLDDLDIDELKAFSESDEAPVAEGLVAGIEDPGLASRPDPELAAIAGRVRSVRRRRRRRRSRDHYKDSKGKGGWGGTRDRHDRHGRHGRRGRRSRLKRWRWPLYIGCVAAAGLVAAGLVWQARRVGIDRGPMAHLMWDMEPDKGPVPGLPDYDQALELAERFVVETDIDEVLGMIRPWPGMREVVAEFLAGNPPPEGAREMLTSMPPTVGEDVSYRSFGLLQPDGVGRLVQVVDTANGPRIDFKAFIEWSSVPATSLVDGSVRRASEVRAIVTPSTYYNYEFADSERFQAFSATLNGCEKSFTVYTLRGSDEEDSLLTEVGRIGMHPATFSLTSLGQSHRHQQFLITELLATGFVVPASLMPAEAVPDEVVPTEAVPLAE